MRVLWIFLGVLILSSAPLARDARADSVAVVHQSGPGYELYRSVSADAPPKQAPRSGILMMGGGDYFPAAFRWLFEHGGRGRLVVLRASGADDLNHLFMDEIGGVSAVDTLVFRSREASNDATVLDIVRAADMIFIAGGDQANYINFWRGTPMLDAINAHVAAGRPIGGTSAGLAVQGAWVYGALDGGSITAPETLGDPLGAGNTLIDNFLVLPHLQHVITDSHFSPRKRLGRLIGWLARLRAQNEDTQLIGIGIDEATALAVEGDGSARVLRAGKGMVWVVEPSQAAAPMVAGKPLTIQNVCVTALDPDTHYFLPSGKREKVAGEWLANVQAGKLSKTPGSCSAL